MSNVVLAAIDLQHPEHHAAILSKAARMAEMDSARIAVVTVVPGFGMSIVGSFFEEGAAQAALDAAAGTLHQVVANAFNTDASAEVKHILRSGTAYEQILETATEFEPELIVMRAHRPDLKDYILGPNAARVVRHSSCSVLVLRD